MIGVAAEGADEMRDDEEQRLAHCSAKMDTGAAGHAMPEMLFPRVRTERNGAPKKIVKWLLLAESESETWKEEQK